MPRLDYLRDSVTEQAAKNKQAITQFLVDKVTINSNSEVSIYLAIPKLESVDDYCMSPPRW